jgi:glycine cleavage system H protein
MDPKTLRYAKSHEWAHVEGNVVTVGITKFAADQLTDITYIELPDVGDHVFKNQDFGNIETVKAVSELYAPVDGEVVAVNEQLDEDPNLVVKDPFGAGWLIKVRIERPSAIDHLLTPEQYAKQVESEGH